MMTRPSALNLLVGCAGLLIGCKNSDGGATRQEAPPSEPERFSFVLPESDVKVELRGEGSETLRAPVGAHVATTETGSSVDAGPDFALEIVFHAPTLSEFRGGGVARVLGEADLNLFKSAQGYSFVVVRELVPEWDESARQRFACGSAGGALRGESTGASVRGFSKAAAEHMVASCRSLEFPPLE
jgi:hypothetical protein